MSLSFSGLHFHFLGCWISYGISFVKLSSLGNETMNSCESTENIFFEQRKGEEDPSSI